jgi:hypothetical protein
MLNGPPGALASGCAPKVQGVERRGDFRPALPKRSFHSNLDFAFANLWVRGIGIFLETVRCFFRSPFCDVGGAVMPFIFNLVEPMTY